MELALVKNVFITKHNCTVGQIVNDFANNGNIVFDDLYDIPAMCSHIDDELLRVLLQNSALVLYGVSDRLGYFHMNIDDFNRLKEFLGNVERDGVLNYRRRSRAIIHWYCLDYDVDESIKKDFWMKVIPNNNEQKNRKEKHVNVYPFYSN